MKLGDPWVGQPPEACDICKRPLMRGFVDGKTSMGPWAIMCPSCRVDVGPMVLGTGRGQKFERSPATNNVFVKTG